MHSHFLQSTSLLSPVFQLVWWCIFIVVVVNNNHNHVHAFAPTMVVRPATTSVPSSSFTTTTTTTCFAVEQPTANVVESKDDDDDDDDDTLEKVEMLGRGAAKTKRGKRKGSSGSSGVKPKVNLAPEEVYYEGPPAITETIAPTVSILTVVGIIPAAAAWARQAWVRYKITTRRIRVTSGMGGKDMAEIVYPDIVELRTARRLFGDGDLVAYLRDGAKFEMRNVPNFEETMEFILKQVEPDVAKAYRAKTENMQ